MRYLNPLVHHIELSEVQASRIAVDPSGQFVTLAGTKELVLFSFDSPSRLHTFPLNVRCEPTGLAWHPDDSSRLAVIRHTRCELLLWDVTEGRLASVHGLGGYVRPITSFDWSRLHPYLLATSSADQFRAICVWDLRDLTRPARAIESLSAPTVIKWNRMVQEKFACSHRNEIRLWDLRANVPEQYLTQPTMTTVTDFSWRPTAESELCVACRGGHLHVWDWRTSDTPTRSIQLTSGSIKKVSYTPSGDHVVTLPEPSAWPSLGLGAWNATSLQKTVRGLWMVENGRNAAASSHPKTSESVVIDFAWRKFTAPEFGRHPDQEDCFTQDRDELPYGAESDLIESPIQLVTWSMDRQVRLYPIQWSTISSIRDSISVVASKHVPQSSGCAEPAPLTEAPNPAVSSVAAEARPQTIRRLQISTNAVAKHRLGEFPSRSEEGHTRIGFNKWASAGPNLAATSTEAQHRITSQEASAYQVLDQELSLLSPRAGQYKLEEVDLINRNAKLMLYYCRRKHFHHYTVCSMTSGAPGRRNSAELDDNGDLESLLLPPNDLLPDTSGRAESWRQNDRCQSSEELDVFTCNEAQRERGQQQQQQQQHVTSQSLKHNSQQQQPPQNQTQQSSSGVKVPVGSGPALSEASGAVELQMPLSGTVTLSVDFPLTYPASVPIFNVVDQNPSLPNEVVEQLKQILHSTACELTHTSRGCMEPCVRKAIDFLQNVTPFRPSTPANRSTTQSEDSLESSSATTRSIQSDEVPVQSTNKSPLASVSVKHEHASRCPFPRLSGVCFAPDGHLVAFGLRKSWTQLINSTIVEEAVGSVTVPNINQFHSEWTPRTYEEFCQTRKLLEAVWKQRHRQQQPQPQLLGQKELDRDQTDDGLSDLQVGTDNPQEDESELTGADRSSGESQLKEMIQELVLGSIEIDRKSNDFSSTPLQDSGHKLLSHLASHVTNTEISVPSPVAPTKIPITMTALTRGKDSRRRSFLQTANRSIVQLYDMRSWIVDTNLVRRYSLNNEDVHDMCIHNFLVALDTGRKDLIQFWQYAIVLSASFTSVSWSSGTVPPWPMQPMGWPLFHEWISYFVRMTDVQNVAMAILVLQGLDAMYKAQHYAPLTSCNSIGELSFTLDERAASRCDTTRAQSCQQAKRTPESRPAANEAPFDVSPSDTTVSFMLDTSYEFPNEEEGRMQDKLPHGINPDHSQETQAFQQIRSCADPYAKHLRLIPLDYLPRFSHYISVYAGILYALGAFLRHARLIRSWTWGLRSRSAIYPVPYQSGNHDHPYVGAWPRGVTEALLLPLCPTCDTTTTTLPSHNPDETVSVVRCPQCISDFSVPNSTMPNWVSAPGDSDLSPRRHVPNLQCTVCRTRVRGLVFICERCNHGGHIDHLSQWFRDSDEANQSRQCPALNCSCYCLQPNSMSDGKETLLIC